MQRRFDVREVPHTVVRSLALMLSTYVVSSMTWLVLIGAALCAGVWCDLRPNAPPSCARRGRSGAANRFGELTSTPETSASLARPCRRGECQVAQRPVDTTD